MKHHFFTTCGEGGKEGPNRGVCDDCARDCGYADKPFSDDVDPAQRPMVPLRVVEVGRG